MDQANEQTLFEKIKKLLLPESVIKCLIDLSEIQGETPIFIKLVDELTIFSINTQTVKIKSAAFDQIKEIFDKSATSN